MVGVNYNEFIKSKHKRHESCGIDIDESDVNDNAFDFQRAIVRWNARKGQCGTFADCGLGKSLMELDWLRLMIRKGGCKRALLLTPVAVGPQMLREANKFNIDCDVRLVADSSQVKSGINVTNYEKLHKFDPAAFDAVCLDESSILKGFARKTKRALCEAFKNTKYRLVATATPAPNDHMELGNQCEFLSVMPSSEMLARWFINDTMKAGGYRLKGHAADDYWNWVASWAMSIRKPSDIGFSDDGYKLLPMKLHEHVVESEAPPGFLFTPDKAVTATTVHQEKRSSLDSKVQIVSDLVNGNDEYWAVWCDTDYEADALCNAIVDSIEVRGSESGDRKAAKLQAFTDGEARVIITKPEIGGFGLNWQHCHNTTYFAGFSFERWYQSVRRFWRFGQQKPVNVHLIASENEAGVVKTLKRKQRQSDEMSAGMVAAMAESMRRNLQNDRRDLVDYESRSTGNFPSWLQTKRGSREYAI